MNIGDIVERKDGVPFSNGEMRLSVQKIEDGEPWTEGRKIWLENGRWIEDFCLNVVGGGIKSKVGKPSRESSIL
jgi:hypothetical protein